MLEKILTRKNIIIAGAVLLAVILLSATYIIINFNGYLIIENESADFTLKIDGVQTAYTPGQPITIRAGKHQIVATSDDTKDKTQEIEIKYNKETKITIELDPATDDADYPELRLPDLEYN